MINWDKQFADAHLHSGPGRASLCIQNAKPPGGRNIFSDDKKEIMDAAKKFGYRMVLPKGIPPERCKAISFVRFE